MGRTIGRSIMAASVALLAVATACNDAQNPQSPRINAWAGGQTSEISGLGSIPTGGVVSFDFDVTSDETGVHGSFSAADASGNTLNGTSFSNYESSSSFCATPSNGAEFDGVGTLFDLGVTSTAHYHVKACDNGPLPGGDTFSIDIVENGFHADGTVVGKITKT
jgi:hypothetical protein